MRLTHSDVTVLWRRERHDHAAARDGSRHSEDRTALRDQARHSGSSAAGSYLNQTRCPSATRFGMPEGPTQDRTWNDGSRCGPQRGASAVDQAANRPAGEPESGCDLFVARAVQRSPDKHLTLKLRQQCHARQCGACLEPVLDDLVDVNARDRVFDLWRGRRSRAEVTDGDVMCDAVQPRLDLSDLCAGFERPPCLEQRLLKRVLRVCRLRRQPPAVGEQLVAVSAHKRLERWLVTLARELGQAAVGLGLKKSQ
jgi:hypothetical protein